MVMPTGKPRGASRPMRTRDDSRWFRRPAATRPLLDSRTDHAPPRRTGAVLRTTIRAPHGAPVQDTAPANPDPAAHRARDGERATVDGGRDHGSEPLRSPPEPGRHARDR